MGHRYLLALVALACPVAGCGGGGGSNGVGTPANGTIGLETFAPGGEIHPSAGTDGARNHASALISQEQLSTGDLLGRFGLVVVNPPAGAEAVGRLYEHLRIVFTPRSRGHRAGDAAAGLLRLPAGGARSRDPLDWTDSTSGVHWTGSFTRDGAGYSLAAVGDGSGPTGATRVQVSVAARRQDEQHLTVEATIVGSVPDRESGDGPAAGATTRLEVRHQVSADEIGGTTTAPRGWSSTPLAAR